MQREQKSDKPWGQCYDFGNIFSTKIGEKMASSNLNAAVNAE
jgi:hypothetical protein